MTLSELLKLIITNLGVEFDDRLRTLREYLDLICEGFGIDVETLPDHLTTTYIRYFSEAVGVEDDGESKTLGQSLMLIAEALGADTSQFSDGLLSTLLVAIAENASGGGAGGTTYADQLYSFYGVDKDVYPYLGITYIDNQGAVSVQVVFGKTIGSPSSAMRSFENAKVKATSDFKKSDWSEDIEEFIGQVMTRLTPPMIDRESVNLNDREYEATLKAKAYVNHSSNLKNYIIYRLDE